MMYRNAADFFLRLSRSGYVPTATYICAQAARQDWRNINIGTRYSRVSRLEGLRSSLQVVSIIWEMDH